MNSDCKIPLVILDLKVDGDQLSSLYVNDGYGRQQPIPMNVIMKGRNFRITIENLDLIAELEGS